MIIKNFKQIALSKEREMLLDILDFGLQKTKPEVVLKSQIKRVKDTLYIQDLKIDLSKKKSVIVVAIGKMAGNTCAFLEKLLYDKIKKGFCIDVSDKDLKLIKHQTGTHPYPSKINATFSENIVKSVSHLSKDDLVLAVVSGGGSSLFCMPHEVECQKGAEIFKELTKKGANIEEINTVRKHLSLVKGGNLAKYAYPAEVVSLIFSDVPGDDISYIASGPTVKDHTTIQDAKRILKEYDVAYSGKFFETPKDDKYFERVHNILVCSNKIPLFAMQKRAKKHGIIAKILSFDLQGNAETIGKFLMENTEKGELLLAGGETTVKIKGAGKGGRNQHTALATLKYINKHLVFIACASDGYDNTEFAGAIADEITLKHARKKELNIDAYLENNDSFKFFEETGDFIYTGKTDINVSDLFMVYKF